MKEYPSNNFDSPPDEIENTQPNPAPSPGGGIQIKKRGSFRRMIDNFIQEDARSIADHVIGEIIEPAIRKMIFDTIVNASERTLFKNGGNSILRSGLYSGASKLSYGGPSYYDYRNSYNNGYGSRPVARDDRPSYKSGFDYRDIIFESRDMADQVILQLDELKGMYPTSPISISDYIETVKDVLRKMNRREEADMIPSTWTNNGYGWDDTRSARVEYDPSTRGYIIHLPKPMPIN